MSIKGRPISLQRKQNGGNTSFRESSHRDQLVQHNKHINDILKHLVSRSEDIGLLISISDKETGKIRHHSNT